MAADDTVYGVPDSLRRSVALSFGSPAQTKTLTQSCYLARDAT